MRFAHVLMGAAAIVVALVILQLRRSQQPNPIKIFSPVPTQTVSETTEEAKSWIDWAASQDSIPLQSLVLQLDKTVPPLTTSFTNSAVSADEPKRRVLAPLNAQLIAKPPLLREPIRPVYWGEREKLSGARVNLTVRTLTDKTSS
jgi:hypothetical protein